jgi:WhiB family transcriptional regulator, redox-sensing transcriptional regulator
MTTGGEQSSVQALGRQRRPQTRTTKAPARLRHSGSRDPQTRRTRLLTSWTEVAACRGADPDLFFPIVSTRQRKSLEQIDEAKAICRSCPVIDACRAWALDNPAMAEFGVWGGTTEEERKAQRRTVRLATRKH